MFLDQSLANMYTLSGVPYFSTHLGLFDGDIITDNISIHDGMEELEFAIEELGLENTLPINSFYFVSQEFGNNILGVKGSLKNTWADPWSAADDAPAGSTIMILDGEFLMDTIGGVNGNVFF